MTETTERQTFAADGITAPLRHSIFRRIWLASLLSNLGILIQGVGAAWAMMQMASSADKVALVQTALMLPVMLIAMPAGAIADMHDRRVVAMISLAIALTGATALTVLDLLHLITPNILLALCFIVGSGMALFGPAWQSSVSEQVPSETLPSAVALNGISYNIARSFGPAIGGIIVAAAGAVAAFALNAVLYIPLLIVLYLWDRVSEPSRLPRERLTRAMVSGARYITNSPPIKIVLARTFLTGLIGGSVMALMPLVARDLLHGGAQTYGILLGAFGMGAVIGALCIAEIRRRLSGEAAVRACALSMGGAIIAIGLSRMPVLTAAALVVAGSVWMLAVALYNIGVQLSAPRWVAGPLARGVPGFDCRRDRDRCVGLGPSHRLLRRRDRAALLGHADAAVVDDRRDAAAAAGRRAQRGRRGAGRSRGAAATHGTQRAAGGRDRIPRGTGQCARLP